MDLPPHYEWLRHCDKQNCWHLVSEDINTVISETDWFSDTVTVNGPDCKRRFGVLSRSFNQKRNQQLSGDTNVLINWKHTQKLREIFQLEPKPRTQLASVINELTSINRKLDSLATLTMSMERKFRDLNLEVELVEAPAESENFEENDQIANPGSFNPERIIENMLN